MSVGSVMSGVICGACGFLFMAIGLWFYKMRKEAAWFWSGSQGQIKTSDLTDVAAYNKANGLMWLVYGGFWVLTGAVSAFFLVPGLVLTFLAFVPGIPIIGISYGKIWKKYARTGAR